MYKASWKEKVMGQQIHSSVVDVDIVAIHLIDVNLKMLPANNVERKDICSQCVNWKKLDIKSIIPNISNRKVRKLILW